MAKSPSEGIQKIQMMRPGREESIRDTAVRLFVLLAHGGQEPSESATRAIEAAIAFEDAWRNAKESGKLEAKDFDDDMFTP